MAQRGTELYYRMGEQLDIVKVNNGRVYYLVTDHQELAKYATLIPEQTIESSMSESLYHNPSKQYNYTSTKEQKISDSGTSGISSEYSCYRNVTTIYNTVLLYSYVFPSLCEVITIGESYLQSIGDADRGRDMEVFKVTNFNSTSQKSNLFVVCGIHARELASPESCLRFAEDLIFFHNSDPDVTWILDYTEVHFILLSNPDGREDEEAQLSAGNKKYFRRKNMHFNTETTACAPGKGGVDLNRNFPHSKWNTIGVTDNKCGQVFPGESAGSEPEIRAITSYVQSVLDQQKTKAIKNVRGNIFNGATPGAQGRKSMPHTSMKKSVEKVSPYSDTNAFTGVLIDVQSFGQGFFWPRTWSDEDTSDEVIFESIAKKLASHTAPTYKTDNEFYGYSGSIMDWAYDNAGLASISMELGTSFYEDCESFQNEVTWNALEALLYAARVSRAPDEYAMGPDIINIGLSQSSDRTLDVTVTASDSYRSGGHRTGEQHISKVSVYVNEHPYEPTTTATATVNSGFTSKTATVVFSVDVTTLPDGLHTLYLQSEDTDGAGPVYAEYFVVPLNYNETTTTGNGPFVEDDNFDDNVYDDDIDGGDDDDNIDSVDDAVNNDIDDDAVGDDFTLSFDDDIFNDITFDDDVWNDFFDDDNIFNGGGSNDDEVNSSGREDDKMEDDGVNDNVTSSFDDDYYYGYGCYFNTTAVKFWRFVQNPFHRD